MRSADDSATAGQSPEQQEHEVRIYRFWAYDPCNELPQESAYFLKMIQIINMNNMNNSPRNNPFSVLARKNQRYPRDGFNNISNYLLHSE